MTPTFLSRVLAFLDRLWPFVTKRYQLAVEDNHADYIAGLRDDIDRLVALLQDAERRMHRTIDNESRLASFLAAVIEADPQLQYNLGTMRFDRHLLAIRMVAPYSRTMQYEIRRPAAYLSEPRIDFTPLRPHETRRVEMVRFGMEMALEPQTPAEIAADVISRHMAEQLRRAIIDHYAAQAVLGRTPGG